MGHITRLPPSHNLERIERQLRCPNCGDTYLHHGKIEVFHRPREGAPSTAISVEGERVAAANPDDNPSAYRGGLSIHFWCEICGRDDLKLVLAQHKGETLWHWR